MMASPIVAGTMTKRPKTSCGPRHVARSFGSSAREREARDKQPQRSDGHVREPAKLAPLHAPRTAEGHHRCCEDKQQQQQPNGRAGTVVGETVKSTQAQRVGHGQVAGIPRPNSSDHRDTAPGKYPSPFNRAHLPRDVRSTSQHAASSTADQSRSVAWYRSILGLTPGVSTGVRRKMTMRASQRLRFA
jgi:hypothetical protein